MFMCEKNVDSLRKQVRNQKAKVKSQKSKFTPPQHLPSFLVTRHSSLVTRHRAPGASLNQINCVNLPCLPNSLSIKTHILYERYLPTQLSQALSAGKCRFTCPFGPVPGRMQQAFRHIFGHSCILFIEKIPVDHADNLATNLAGAAGRAQAVCPMGQ
jgi:hypothetical protein